MKKIVFASLMVSAVAIGVFAEPLTIEQAGNVMQKNRLEAGINIDYGIDKFTVKGVSGTDYDKATGSYNLFARYGLLDNVEMALSVPYVWWELETKTASATSSSDESGLGDLSFMGKYAFFQSVDGMALAGMLAAGIPTGDEKEGLGCGLDLMPALVFSKKLSVFVFDVNAGYEFRGKYDNAAKVEINPGDTFVYGASAAYSWNEFTFITEVSGESTGKEEQNGIKINGTKADRIDIIPGMRYGKGNLKAKIGVKSAVGKEDYRFYDWKAFSGISYVF